MKTTLETQQLETGVDSEHLEAGSGDDIKDLATREWRQHWTLSRWGLEMTLET